MGLSSRAGQPRILRSQPRPPDASIRRTVILSWRLYRAQCKCEMSSQEMTPACRTTSLFRQFWIDCRPSPED
jgi:hypothetical protein